MIISSIQKARLRYLHSYEWALDDNAGTSTRVKGLISDIENAIELWYASIIVQWDLSCDYGMYDIIRNKNMDIGVCKRLLGIIGGIVFHEQINSAQYVAGYRHMGDIVDGLRSNGMSTVVSFDRSLVELDVLGFIELNFGIQLASNPGYELPYDYEIVFINDISEVAQQVDSAEASTIAVPPSRPSGSPR
jgi:hypothetical protein